MKKIVVPTNFSLDAEKAYPLAVEIARKANAEIIFLHVISSHIEFINTMPYGDFTPTVVFDDNPVDEVNRGREKLESLVKLEMFNGLKVDYFINDSFRSDPLKDILSFLNKEEHSLVIMGTSGDDYGGDTNTEVIVRKSIIPVLTVKGNIQDINIEKILVPTDFHTVDLKFIHRITTLAEVFKATIEYVYINTPKHFKDTDYIEKEWKRFQKRYGLATNVFSIFNDHDIELGIAKMITKSSADMLAIPTHGRTGLGHFFRASYTEDIVNDVSIPVYSYNMSNDYHPGMVTNIVTARGFTG